MLEMSIESIRVSLMNYQRVVILKQQDADRYLPIWVGPAEADAIAVKLQDVTVPRPLTHDLLDSVIDSLGGKVSHITVSDLQNDTFYAKIVLNVDSRTVEVDSRPSDAIALAVRTRVPIYADEAVLDRAGVLLDKETGQPIMEERPPDEEGRKIGEEEMRRLSAFKDFVEGLNLEDLGKGKAS